MSYANIYIHLVWSTKNREPYLENIEIRKKVWEHIAYQAKKHNIHLYCINGYKEHCHCLIALKVDQTIAKVAQLLKGESSLWINKNKIIPYVFKWQTEYFAVSISKSNFFKIKNYIDNQEKHHLTKTYEEEYNNYIKSIK